MSETPHVDHGTSPARWTGAVISALGWALGGPALFLGNWPLVGVAVALQVIAIVVALVMNAAGLGRPDVWGDLKAKAAAERGTA